MLGETPMGKFRLTSMRNRMVAFTAANPEAILNADDFFEAVNVIAGLEAGGVAARPTSSRGAGGGAASQAAAGEAAPPAHSWRGAALSALFGGDGAPDADGAARAPPPLFTSTSALGTFPPTYSFDDGCALVPSVPSRMRSLATMSAMLLKTNPRQRRKCSRHCLPSSYS